MNIQALTIEQMRHLEELGLDTSDASMWWSCTYPRHLLVVPQDLEEPDWDYVKEEGGYPAYSLQDVLDNLSKFDEINWELTETGMRINNMHEEIIHEEVNYLIDSAYNSLCWCIKNLNLKEK